jgi:metal-dependent HD superfamily phosphatase/phosphodiesterase
MIVNAQLTHRPELADTVAGLESVELPHPTHERPFHVPAKRNKKLAKLIELINKDDELQQLWRCANVNAVERSHITDHGPIHIRVVANIALRLLRLLDDAGVEYSVVQHYGLEHDDAEVIVVLAATLHDIGISIHRTNHEQYSLILAAPKARAFLRELYAEPELTIMVSETLHAIIAHHSDVRCLTIEAGVVKVGDALDMSKGRSRIPFESGKVDIHSVSAMAINGVALGKGKEKPIGVAVAMNNSAGIFQLDELLKPKLLNSSIAQYVEVVASIQGESEQRILSAYML